MLKGNAVIGQSGGPTSVINSSLVGVLDGCREIAGVQSIYGMRFGIEGMMAGQLVDLGRQPAQLLRALRKTPSSALGSCRHKVRDEDLPRILDVLSQHAIRYLFLIGGNDTMDTIHRVESHCRNRGYDLIGIGVPKTVDNDLYGTDHTPGFPSAARSNMLNVLQGGWLARDMKKVDAFVVYQTIGRDAGWLAAATAVARRKVDDAPHLIYCPERRFDRSRLIADTRACIDRYGWASIVVSEGLRYADGTPVSASQAQDKFSNTEFGAMGGASVGLNVHRMLSDELGLRGEFQITESLIMSAMDRAVPLDLEEAYRCGRHAAQLAGQGQTGCMVAIERLRDDPYAFALGQVALEEVAVRAKAMPDAFINERGNHITDEALGYLRPLVGEVPDYVELEPIVVPSTAMPDFNRDA